MQSIFGKEKGGGFTLNKKKKKYQTINVATIQLIQDNSSGNNSIGNGVIDSSHHRFIFFIALIEKNNVTAVPLMMIKDGEPTKDIKLYKFVDFLIRDDAPKNEELWKFMVIIFVEKFRLRM